MAEKTQIKDKNITKSTEAQDEYKKQNKKEYSSGDAGFGVDVGDIDRTKYVYD